MLVKTFAPGKSGWGQSGWFLGGEQWPGGPGGWQEGEEAEWSWRARGGGKGRRCSRLRRVRQRSQERGGGEADVSLHRHAYRQHQWPQPRAVSAWARARPPPTRRRTAPASPQHQKAATDLGLEANSGHSRLVHPGSGPARRHACTGGRRLNGVQGACGHACIKDSAEA